MFASSIIEQFYALKALQSLQYTFAVFQFACIPSSIKINPLQQDLASKFR